MRVPAHSVCWVNGSHSIQYCKPISCYAFSIMFNVTISKQIYVMDNKVAERAIGQHQVACKTENLVRLLFLLFSFIFLLLFLFVFLFFVSFTNFSSIVFWKLQSSTSLFFPLSSFHCFFPFVFATFLPLFTTVLCLIVIPLNVTPVDHGPTYLSADEVWCRDRYKFETWIESA